MKPGCLVRFKTTSERLAAEMSNFSGFLWTADARVAKRQGDDRDDVSLMVFLARQSTFGCSTVSGSSNDKYCTVLCCDGRVLTAAYDDLQEVA